MNFEKFLQLDRKYLNLGSAKDIHPNKKYRHYVGINPPGRFQNKVMNLQTGRLVDHPDILKNKNAKHGTHPWIIYHDLEKPFPLPDNCVEQIHSEDCFEHIEKTKYPQILEELYRILKPNGFFRLAVPDYMNPKDRFCLQKGYDPRNNLHVTLTTFELLKPYLDSSPFQVSYLHYWKYHDTFVENKIDYSLGFVKRTPDNDKRNKGSNRLLVTSFVADLIKS